MISSNEFAIHARRELEKLLDGTISSNATNTSLLGSKLHFLPYEMQSVEKQKLALPADSNRCDWKFMLPSMLRKNKKYNTDSFRSEAIHFMSGLMDEATHLKNYETPIDPSLTIIVVAEKDAYQPREGIAALPDIWP